MKYAAKMLVQSVVVRINGLPLARSMLIGTDSEMETG